MRDNDTIGELIEIVVQRASFLSCLTDGAKDKRTLVAELEYSRSTVDRGVRELQAVDLVEYSNGAYQLTPLGAGIMDSFDEFTSTAEQWVQLHPFLRWVDEDVLDFDYGLLDDAEIVVAEPGDPYAVINQHVKRIGEMNEGHFLLPFVGLHATEVAYEQVISRDMESELVVAPSVLETIQTNDEYTDRFEEMVATGRFDVYRATTELPVCLGLLDDRVQMIAADGEQPRVLIETTQNEVYEWAAGIFETHKRQAELTMTSPTSKITTS